MGTDSPDNMSADRRGHVRSDVTADRADRADPPDMAAPPTFTTTEAAVRLGVSERTVRRYVERGKLEARLMMTHRGEEWHIAAADVETFRQQRDAIRSRPITMDDSESPATTDMAADAHGHPVRTLTPAIVQALVAPLVAEIERLATEKGQAEGERDILRQQLTERENQAHDLVGELRRRAEVAEHEAAELRRARRQMPWWVRLLVGGQ